MKSDVLAAQVLHSFQLALVLLCDGTGVETLPASRLGILPYGDKFNRASSTLPNAKGGSRDAKQSTLQI